MTNSRNLKAGVIGLGVGEHHLRSYQSVPGINVIAVCDFDEARVAEVGRRYGVIRRTNDWRAVTEDPEIDIVSVCSFDDAHAEQAVSALENGKHVFIEKPLCLFPEEAAAIGAALRARPHLKLSSNLPLRTCPRFERLREAMQSGTMGQVYHLEADYLWGRPHKLVDGWRRRMPHYSIVLGASIHMIDLIMWLKGETPEEVFGFSSGRALAGHALGFDDFAVNVFRFADGTCAKVAAHSGGGHPHFHEVRAYGTQKTFHHTFDGAYWVDDRDPDSVLRPEAADYPARAERGRVLASFLAHIGNPANPPLVTADDAFASMDVAFAAERAIREGRPQTIVYSPSLATETGS